MCRIEELYETPTDIEWAYAGGQLHVLQARPITTYVPLPPEMLTKPGERRRLYVDAALSKGMTINAPISPMGLDWMEDTFSSIIERFLGQVQLDLPPREGLWFVTGGRMYMNFSNMMWLASPKTMSKSSAPNDALMADILANVEAKRYRAATRPPWLRFRILWFIPRVLWQLRGFFWNMLWAILSPERARRAYQRKIEAYERELTENLDYGLPLDEFRRTNTVMAPQMFDVIMSALVAGLVPADLVVRRNSAEAEALADKLKRGFTGNVVVEMGIALFRLAKQLTDPTSRT